MRHALNFDAKKIQALPDFKLQVELTDGQQGYFDMTPHLALPGFSALRDPAYFNRVAILYGAATWPDGEDIAPETLAAELKTLASA